MDISVVIPCYHSANSLVELTQRISKSVSGFARSYEIILVHDAGSDNTWQVIKNLCTVYEPVKGVNLIRNLGQHNATLCGLSYAEGDIVVTLDDDLQHPPEEIKKLYQHLKKHEDVDVVFGSYLEKRHNRMRNFGTFVLKQVRNIVIPAAARIEISSFRAFKKKIVKELTLQRPNHPRIGLMTLAITTRIENVDVLHDKRKHGKSSYSPVKLIKAAMVTIINYSSLPFQFIRTFGASVALISLLAGIGYFISYFSGVVGVPGLTALAVAILFVIGLILFSFGHVGEYLNRIIKQQAISTHYPIRNSIIDNKSGQSSLDSNP